MGVYDIQGINCVFQLKIGEEYKTVVCAKSFTFNPITDMKETTTVGSGFWKEFRPRKLSYTITFNGMHQVESLTTQERTKTMMDYQFGFLPLPYRLIYTDNSNNVMVVDGSVYVTSTLLDASPVNLVNATMELQGNGPVTISDEIPDLANITITSLGDEATGALFQFKLFNSNGDIVFDSGQLEGASGGNLTHPVNVTGTVQKGTYSYFWQVTSDNIGNAFELDAPPTKNTVFNDGTVNENSFGVQTYDFTVNRAVSFTMGVQTPPPACVPPSIPGSPTLPEGQVGSQWATMFAVSGSQPAVLSNITKPSWMSLELNTPTPGGGTYAMLNGIPDTAGTGIVVSFDITNDCGTVSFSDTIDIAAAPVTSSIMQWEFVEDGSQGTFRIYVNSVLTVSRTEPGTDQFVVNQGDVVEVQLLGVILVNKWLDVHEIVDSVQMYDEQGSSNKIFSFTVVAAKHYYAYAEIG